MATSLFWWHFELLSDPLFGCTVYDDSDKQNLAVGVSTVREESETELYSTEKERVLFGKSGLIPGIW